MKGRKLAKVFCLVIVLLALILAPMPVGAASPEVSIPNATVGSGQAVTLPINITGITNLGTTTIWLSYNKDVVTVDNVTEGDIGVVTYAIYNDKGVTKMTWFNAYGVSGKKVFAQVTLHAATTTQKLTSPLDLDVKEFVDITLNSITPGVKSGIFTVSQAPPATASGAQAPATSRGLFFLL